MPSPACNCCPHRNECLNKKCIKTDPNQHNQISGSDTIFSQKKYDNEVNKVNLYDITCSCGKKGCMIGHGSYKRKYRSNDTVITISIKRVRCKECNRTHALMTPAIVPYSQVSMDLTIKILNCYINRVGNKDEILGENLSIDESTYHMITSKYNKSWKEKIKSMSINIKQMFMQLHRLIVRCLLETEKQFMESVRQNRQEKKRIHKLYLRPT